MKCESCRHDFHTLVNAREETDFMAVCRACARDIADFRAEQKRKIENEVHAWTETATNGIHAPFLDGCWPSPQRERSVER